MYCGSNRNNPEVKSGRKRIGNRYNCFRKGIGVGLSLPYSPEYTIKYAPVDRRKIYCGKEAQLPVGYHILGNNTMCLTKGVGVGRTIKARRRKKK